MSTTQNSIQAPSSGELSPSQNPQAVSGQAVTTSSDNIQSAASSVLNSSQGLSITSVGDSKFSPVNTGSVIQNSVGTVAKPRVNHHYLVIIGSGIVVLLSAAICWWMVRASHKAARY